MPHQRPLVKRINYLCPPFLYAVMMTALIFFMPDIARGVVSSQDLALEITAVNSMMDDITDLMAEKKLEEAKTAINNATIALRAKASSSYFYYSVLDVKRNEEIDYIPPPIAPFPSALRSDYYSQVRQQISDGYHTIREKLTKAEMLLGQKKYKVALSICIEAFTTSKNVTDLIQSAGDPIEIIQLPKNLSDMVEDGKASAQQIESHFDAISTEKEKIVQVNKTRDNLVQIMYAVRVVERFVIHNRLDINELEDYHTVCRRHLEASTQVTIKPSGTVFNFPASEYAEALQALMEDFRQEIITQSDYILARDKTLQEAVDHYEAISEPSDSTIEDYTDFSVAYRTEAGGYDTSAYNWFVVYTFDETELAAWLAAQNQRQAYRIQWADAVNALFDALHAADFLLESAENFQKPMALTAVDISLEYGAFISDEDYRNAYALPGYAFSGDDVDICNLADGPIVAGAAVSLYNYDAILKSDWITTAGEYIDRLTDRSHIHSRAATQGKRNSPRLYSDYWGYWDNVDNFVYGMMLYDRSKMLDFRNNFQKISDEMDKFPNDWSKMLQDHLGGDTTLSQRLSELKILFITIQNFISTPYVSMADFENLEVTVNPVTQWRADAFLDGILVKTPEIIASPGRIMFRGTPILTSHIAETIDYAVAAHINIQNKAALSQDTVGGYFQKVAAMTDLNDDLEFSSLGNTVDLLQGIQSTKYFRVKLENLLLGLENFQAQMQAGMDLTNIWNTLNGYLNSYDRSFDVSGSGELGNTLMELNTYLDRIRDGAGYYPEKSLFTGASLILEADNRDLVDSIEPVCWPMPTKAHFGRQHPLLVNYLSAEQISQHLPNLRNLLASYKPDPPIPGHFLIIGTCGNDQDSRPLKRLPEKVGIKVWDKNNARPAASAWVAFSFHYNYTPGSHLEAVRIDQTIQDAGGGLFYTRTDAKGEAEIYWHVGNDDIGDAGAWGLRASVTSEANPYGDIFNFLAYNLDHHPERDQNGNNIPDTWEATYAVNGTPLSGELLNVDFDGDGLTAEEEYGKGTDPFNPDTNGNGLPDGADPDPQTSFSSDIAGDLDNDWFVSLQDTIIALQVVCGMFPVHSSFQAANDIGGNGKIGVEEAIFSMSHASE